VFESTDVVERFMPMLDNMWPSSKLAQICYLTSLRPRALDGVLELRGGDGADALEEFMPSFCGGHELGHAV